MKVKILVVDDREDNLLSMEAIFQGMDYELVKARSGSEALKILLHEFDFALILMDVKMPVLNGFETASMIYKREKLKHIPIIFITAQGYEEESIFKGYRTGGVDYIYKPINPEMLRTKVAVFVELYRKNLLLLQQEQRLIAINKNLEHEIKGKIASENQVKALNHQLLEKINNLESVNRDLDRFAFLASHDLQEPLRKIRAFANLIRKEHEENMPAKSKQYLGKIQASAERMSRLIEDILIFAKISTVPDKFAMVDLAVVFEEVIVDLSEEIDSKKAVINIEQLPKLYTNPILMHPLFYNLLSNSLKYSRQGVHPVIDVRTEEVVLSTGSAGETQSYIRIYFKDNGIGFDQKYAEQIFGMFQRLHSYSQYGGTGIGLALCKKIVEHHNGFLSAQGEPGVGSVFIISLPSKSGSHDKNQSESSNNETADTSLLNS